MLTVDRRYLDDEVVPERELILHRRDELERLLGTLHPSRGRPRNWTYVVGPTGVGKTTLARVVLEELASVVDARSTYISCWRRYERGSILKTLAREIAGAPVHESTATAELVELVHSEPDHHRFVVLDEIDQLAETDVLYDLAEAPRLSVLGIANDLDGLWAALDDRTQSRVQVGATLTLGDYSVGELVAILETRAAYAFGYSERSRLNAISERQFERIAQAAAGDARHAITMLRFAVEEAQADNRRQVTDADIDAAIPAAREDVRQRNLSSLNRHQRVLYDVLCEHGPLAPSDLYDRYREQVADPRVERTLRQYLRKLQHYNLVAAEGETHNRTYSAVECSRRD